MHRFAFLSNWWTAGSYSNEGQQHCWDLKKSETGGGQSLWSSLPVLPCRRVPTILREFSMKIEALNIFSTFSIPAVSVKNALKDHDGNPLVPNPHDLKPTDAFQGEERGCGLAQFKPYPAKVPWHSGSRQLMSRLFPRYGNYCGPNWSSGRESGSLIWDQPPIDALDFCCYRHDIGYDSYEQADLHQADMAFLDCLEKIALDGRSPGTSPFSEPYRNLYIIGLRNVLIPYRRYLLQKVDPETRKQLTEEEILGPDRTKNPDDVS